MDQNSQKYRDMYLSGPLTPEERSAIEKMPASDAFDGFPSFGTGGMRAVVDAGTNRLNIYNIARLNMALANVLKESFKNPEIVVAYDSRLSHIPFSRVSYHILKSYGFGVKIFRRPTPTPLLSFAVLETGASAGIVITASHNPPEYNGYKVYWDNGAQIVPPFDGKIEKEFLDIPFVDIPASIHEYVNLPPSDGDLLEEEIIQKYLEKIKKESFVTSSPKKTTILYSPLHGTGGWAFERVFKELHFENFSILPEQKEPDGNFPTVKSPNPEDSIAFELLEKTGAKNKTKLLLASDPDADRVGAALWDSSANGYFFLSGNQIGALLLESAARAKAKTLANPFLCKTIVTTELQRHIAASHGVRTEETLTGFKYIAEVVEKDPENYLFGGEESFGYLPISWVRDKDSLSSSIALAELADKTDLMELLKDIYYRHGFYHEILRNVKLSADKPGLMDKISGRIVDYKNLLGDSIGGRKIVDGISLVKSATEPSTPEGKKFRNSLPESKVLQYWLEPEGRLTVRPSGTEPKIKIYVSLKSREIPTPQTLEDIRKKTEKEAEEIIELFIQKILED